jgi:hypothetical protein
VQTEGMLHAEINKTYETFNASVQLQKGIIHYVSSYNFIKDITAHILFDPPTLKVDIDSAVLALHKGAMRIDKGTIAWDALAIKPFVHIPLLIDNFFVNYDKNIFAVFSGGLLCYNTQDGLQISGKIISDKGQINKNLFSPSLLQNIMPAPVAVNEKRLPLSCDILVESSGPFFIKTAFLNAEVHFCTQLKGSIDKPTIDGAIWFNNGALLFPYKPLYLHVAKIQFVGTDISDPSFELVAKGIIKNYNVTLHGSGSLTHPHIKFESAPALQEEQIISLLLAGSEKDSILFMMPSMIMQNMQNIIFAADQSEFSPASYFKRFLSPFANFRIVPSFADQTGRGGLRWALELDLNDNLRASIQKNFSQLEDTKFEVEYAITDDILVRGIKDEHNDLGGEVELRWKF